MREVQGVLICLRAWPVSTGAVSGVSALICDGRAWPGNLCTAFTQRCGLKWLGFVGNVGEAVVRETPGATLGALRVRPFRQQRLREKRSPALLQLYLWS